MNYNKIFIALLLLAGLNVSYSFSMDLNTIQSVNATIYTQDITPQNYGVINKQTIKSLSLPTSGKAVFIVKPTQGEYTNQPIKVLFYALNADQLTDSAPENLRAAFKKASKNNAETIDQAKTVIGVFYQKPGQTTWTSANQMVSSDSLTDLQAQNAIKIVLTGNGKVVANFPAYQKALKDTSASKLGAAPLIAELKD